MLEHTISESDFREGRGSLIFRKLANKDRQALNQELALPHGPLAKNQATFDFEYIVHQSLNNDDDVTFNQDTPDGDITCAIRGKIFNVSKIIKEMDARLLQFSQQDMDTYMQALTNRAGNLGFGRANYNLDIATVRNNDTDGHLQELHNAQMAAINIYTSEYYNVMNAALKGRNDIKDTHYKLIHCIKEALIHIGMASSGLSRIPDTHCEYAYRADVGVLTKEKLEARLKSIHDPSQITIEEGFLSTSKDNLKWTHGTKIMFHDLIGKDVALLSWHPGENEFLIPPTQVRWEGHQSKDDTHFFVARPVVTPAGLSKTEASMGIKTDNVEKYLEKIAQEGKKPKGLLNKIKAKQAKKLAKKAEELLENKDLSNAEKMHAIQEAGEKAVKRVQKVKLLQFRAESEFGLENALKAKLQPDVTPKLQRNDARKNLNKPS